MQIVVGDTDGQSYQLEIDENKKTALTGLKIGETFSGDVIGLNGYTLEITGGSDADGFPMRPGIPGPGRHRRILKTGVGIRSEERDGVRRRKGVRGNTVSVDTAQLNVKVVEQGSQTIEDALSEDTAEQEAEDAGE